MLSIRFMKIGIISDTHIGLARDSFRAEVIKNYRNAIQMLKDSDIIIHGGDIFDKNDVRVDVFSEFLEPISEMELRMFYILGNHDIMRTNLITDIDRFRSIKSVRDIFLGKLSDDGIRYYQEENVVIYGIDYDEYDAHSKIEMLNRKLDRSKINILVIHQDIKRNGFDGLDPDYLLRTGFDIIVDGHIHSREFIQNKLLIAGSTSITRFDRDDFARDKAVYIYDTETRTLKEIPIPNQTRGVSYYLDVVGEDISRIHQRIDDILNKHPNEFVKIDLKVDKPINISKYRDPRVKIDIRTVAVKDNNVIDNMEIVDIDKYMKSNWNYNYSYDEFLEIIQDPDSAVDKLILLKKDGKI